MKRRKETEEQRDKRKKGKVTRGENQNDGCDEEGRGKAKGKKKGRGHNEEKEKWDTDTGVVKEDRGWGGMGGWREGEMEDEGIRRRGGGYPLTPALAERQRDASQVSIVQGSKCL